MFSGSRYQFFRALSHVTAVSQSSSWACLIHPAIAHLLIYAILTWRSEFDDIWRRYVDGEMVIVRWWWWNQMASSPCIWFNTCFVHQASLTNPLVHLVPGYRFKAKPTHLSENLPGSWQAKEMLLLLLSTLVLIILTKWGFERRAKFRILANYGYNVRQICPVYYIIPYLYEKPRCLQSTTYLGTSTRLPRTTLAQCLTG